ncbi:hypothetical protein, partial [Pseudomonas yamanorum]|uniref:hypothetical protein n=1 Tax=Pseudomonas yamanorum TaxID=515393 RepID=UPI003BACD3DB
HSGLPAGLSVEEQKPNQKLKRARSKNVGAGLLAKVVNDDAGILDERGALRFFASKPAPTEKQICFRSGFCFCF